MKRILRWTLAPVALAAAFASVPGEARAQQAPEAVERRVFRGMHDQLKFDKDVARVAVGDKKVLSAEVLDSRTVLLLGSETGRTSLLVWFSDNSMQAFAVNVQPDYDVLQRALRDIHPSITVDMAPDRGTIVLRGIVPDVSFSRAAEDAANAYLRGGRTEAAPVIAAPAGAEAGQGATMKAAEKPARESVVINLIRVERLPETTEGRIAEAIRSIGAHGVEVVRLKRGDVANDATDTLLLRGRVRDQVMLTRVLQVVGTMYVGGSDPLASLTVVADEAGGLTNAQDTTQGTSASQSISSASGTSGTISSDDLDNLIRSNPGRAKGVSLGGGKILSYIEVTELPQVRVDIRVYEVNRTELLAYAPDFTFIWSDFNQGSLNRSPTAVGVQGIDAARVGGSGQQQDVQSVTGFLANGLTQQLQVAGNHFVIDSVFQILQTRGIARSLANPGITVLSGENADFSAGGEIPIPQSFSPSFGSVETAGTTTPGVYNSVEFRRFGVNLAVRPHVGENGEVTLDLVSRVDRPDAALTALVRETTGTDPETTAFEARAIKTTTRLQDGQSLMIGGLISRSSNDGATFTPYLEKIPVVGWLFKRFVIKDEDKELVIIVNPTIVRDPLPEFGMWEFPDLDASLRGWVESMIDYGAEPRAGAAKKQ